MGKNPVEPIQTRIAFQEAWRVNTPGVLHEIHADTQTIPPPYTPPPAPALAA